MADNFLNKTGLQYYHNRIKTLFGNKIETVKVNGTALIPDAQKAVNIEIDEDVFVATYGTTPAADIIAAIGDGKVIFVTYGAGMPTEVVTYAHHNNGTAYLTTAGISVESGVGFPTASTYTVSGTTWSVAIVQGARRSDVQAIQEVIPSDASDENPLATQEWVEANGGAVSALKLANGTPLANTNEIKSFLIANPTDKQIPLAFTVDGTYAAAVPGKVRLEDDPETEIDVYRIDLQSKPVQYGLECEGEPVPFMPTMYGGTWDISQPVQSMIDESLADITGIDFEVVQTLPAAGQKGVIYLLHNPTDPTDVYDEYIWVDGTPSGHFEKIGNTAVDLSDYWAKTELTAITTAEIDTIVGS